MGDKAAALTGRPARCYASHSALRAVGARRVSPEPRVSTMVRDTRARGVVRSLAAIVALGLAAPLAGCYTQIATVRPESDFTNTTTGDSEEYFPSERSRTYRQRYP